MGPPGFEPWLERDANSNKSSTRLTVRETELGRRRTECRTTYQLHDSAELQTVFGTQLGTRLGSTYLSSTLQPASLLNAD
jgi:hypothetical protein